MALRSIRKRFRPERTSRVFTEPPGPWPVDPALTRRGVDTRRRIQQTRRELARHVLPERRPPRRAA
jgi:hypothetical protein